MGLERARPIQISNTIGFRFILSGKFYSKQHFVKLPKDTLEIFKDSEVHDIGIEFLKDNMILPLGWKMIYFEDENDLPLSDIFFIVDSNYITRVIFNEKTEELIVRCRFTTASLFIPVVNLAKTFIVDNKNFSWTETKKFSPLVITEVKVDGDEYEEIDIEDIDEEEDEIYLSFDSEMISFTNMMIHDIAVEELQKKYKNFYKPRSYWNVK